ncbi:thioredoxin-domain-containing protein [Macrolepiota fuliginosa MF-IS2]|uniref:Thioredoxin n=1 Tax=Macrolepiota fuliginosa MF-IS2 TaxID=1400762 RepID=A0A9P5XNR9_9AGAR|nr:thioredoxin-domain-containing protein [Macrolepiota fuliginosa MF-IS2]
MAITHIQSVSQLNQILSKSKEKLSVIDFHATWCGPCHMIAPTFEALSKKYTNVNFLKCDVDAARDVASLYSVSAMPTFIFLKGSTKIDQVKGADRNALESTLRKHATSSTAAFTGAGRTLGGDQAPNDMARDVKNSVNQATAKVTNLNPQVKVFLGLIGAYLVFWYLSS